MPYLGRPLGELLSIVKKPDSATSPADVDVDVAAAVTVTCPIRTILSSSSS